MRTLRTVPKAALVAYLSMCASLLHGQLSDAWQSVPKEDLALNDNPALPGSEAMILDRQVYTDDEKRSQTEWVRIKILTEKGRTHADVEIPYVAGSTTIEAIRGRTVHPDGAVMPFEGTIFDKVIVKYRKFRYDVKAFTLPGVEVGSVIEYAYTVRWKESLPDYVRHSSNYVFQEGWTVPSATWTIQQELYTRHALFVLHPVKDGRIQFAKVRLPDVSPLSQADGTFRMEVNNVAALEEERFMPPEAMLNSGVHFFYVVGFFSNFWEEFGKLQAVQRAKFVESTHFLEKAANEITPPSDPPETRLRKLYARVQQIRYLSYEPSKAEEEIKREHFVENKSAEDVLRHGYAYRNEINYLFNALARAAGFDASIVEVVDRSSAMFEPEVWDSSQLNAIVVMVRLKNENIFLDPASRFCPYGLLPWFESDTHGVRWDKLGGQVLTTYAPGNDSPTIERTADLKLGADGTLEGTLEVSFTGQEALDRRLSGMEEDEAGRRKLLEDEIKELAPSGATIDVDSITGWDNSDQPLRVKGHLKAPRFAILTKKRMLFTPAVFQSAQKRPFIHTSRVQPVYFRHGYNELDQITIWMPPNYRIEAASPDTAYKASFAMFRAERTNQAGALRLERHTTMNGYYFPVEAYGSLRQFFEKVRQSDAETVVLHLVEAVQPR